MENIYNVYYRYRDEYYCQIQEIREHSIERVIDKFLIFMQDEQHIDVSTIDICTVEKRTTINGNY